MKEKSAILIGGGLGDCIWGYFHQNYNSKLKSILKQHDLEITCYVHSINSHSSELLRYNPYIQNIIVEPYRKICKREVNGIPNMFDLNKYIDDPMDIYLNQEEKNFIENVKNQGRYIVIHPFAGERERCFDNQLINFVDKFKLFDYNVVIIGGSSSREGTDLVENFDYNSQRVISLVNRSNVRVFCHLIKECSFFIGSHSAYMMAAWHYGIKSMCIVPDSFMGYLIPNSKGETQKRYPYVDNLFLPNNTIMFHNQFNNIDKFLFKFLKINTEPPKIPLIRMKK